MQEWYTCQNGEDDWIYLGTGTAGVDPPGLNFYTKLTGPINKAYGRLKSDQTVSDGDKKCWYDDYSQKYEFRTDLRSEILTEFNFECVEYLDE